MLLHGRQTLTEGHGSCTLSVWTLAEPLGVLFQARSDNLAPMTRLATAQFTGRSSTHAQQTPPPLLLPLPPLSPPCSPIIPLSAPLAPSFTSLTLPSLFSQLRSVFFFFLFSSHPRLLSLLLILYHTVSPPLLVSLKNRSFRPSKGDKMS